ncbi:MAG: hypothetical protein U5K69_28650 [Balneolaceae bacterium]|nr:hypothetical protein [Balneolaceae bacterium]
MFPRHLMLDYLGSDRGPNQRTIFRHYFRPSPILDDHKTLRQQMRHLFQRMVRMKEQFKVDTVQEREVKITPSKTAAEPFSERSIPYYYNVDEGQNLVRLWNYQKTRLNKHNLIPSYYSDRAEMQTLMRGYDKHSFLRVEGHIGRNYETVLGEIKEKQDRLNLPIKVVGVKLSKTFENINVSYECRFDDLQELYETFKTELNCLLDGQMMFFRGLEVKKESTEEGEGNEGFTNIGMANIEDFRAGSGITATRTEEINIYDSPITGERRYPKSPTLIPLVIYTITWLLGKKKISRFWT